MEITINGQSREIAASCTLGQIVSELFPSGDHGTPANVADVSRVKGIAIAINQSVVPKSDWPTRLLSPNDHVTVITATQGG
ncbi:sulfur carrier protein ThiS [Dyadobacter sp. 676]|uniref:Sulfur carrier protein ThiS n=1 Tax=Dyadobacter sp. 676 TaxID=3088362 RepID=A0AAU8FG52_9BACT